MPKINWKNIDEKRAYDREMRKRYRLEHPEAEKAAHRKWYLKTRKLMDPELKHQRCSEARKRGWANRLPERLRKQKLREDLMLLRAVIRDLKKPLFAAREKERRRASALAAYYAKREEYNAKRRTAKPLETAFRKVLREQAERRSQLGGVAKRMLVTRVEQRIARALRRRFNKALSLRHRSSYIERLCGCPLLDLRRHLERHFLPGMTWENYGFTGWHIDHIRPCASFNLQDPEQQSVCFHWSNLQPLWAEDNIAKRDNLRGIRRL